MSVYGLFILLLLVITIVSLSVRVISEYERAIIFRFGRALAKPKGPGLIFLIPVVDRVEAKVSVRTITMDIAPQDVITRDNISLKVNAVLYFKVVDTMRAILNVENYLYATSQLAQTHLRSVLGQHMLDEILAERDKINEQLQKILDLNTDPWGIKVVAVEIKHVDLPPDQQRAMAKQAEAERERRAKIIAAEGEMQAAAKLKEAADTMALNPMTLQLRYLQTMSTMSTDQNTKFVFFPMPFDFMKAATSLLGKEPKEL
jgi:regulator of protease activity HflC (stomatin/prohibitin superfamily)